MKQYVFATAFAISSNDSRNIIVEFMQQDFKKLDLEEKEFKLKSQILITDFSEKNYKIKEIEASLIRLYPSCYQGWYPTEGGFGCLTTSSKKKTEENKFRLRKNLKITRNKKVTEIKLGHFQYAIRNSKGDKHIISILLW